MASPDDCTYTLVIYTYAWFGSNMKRKLTVTIDAEVLPLAKSYARSRGVSLSSVIERSLWAVVGEDSPSFSSRWRGRFLPADRDDPRYAALAEKYL